MAIPRLAAHGFLHLPALGVGRVRGDEAFHAAGLHRDDAHGDTTQPSAAHDDGLTPALQIPGHEAAKFQRIQIWILTKIYGKYMGKLDQ